MQLINRDSGNIHELRTVFEICSKIEIQHSRATYHFWDLFKIETRPTSRYGPNISQLMSIWNTQERKRQVGADLMQATRRVVGSLPGKGIRIPNDLLRAYTAVGCIKERKEHVLAAQGKLFFVRAAGTSSDVRQEVLSRRWERCCRTLNKRTREIGVTFHNIMISTAVQYRTAGLFSLNLSLSICLSRQQNKPSIPRTAAAQHYTAWRALQPTAYYGRS